MPVTSTTPRNNDRVGPAAAPAAVACYHCGEAVPEGSDFHVVIQGRERPMCCPGCRAVATLIADSGMGDFYLHRSAYNERPSESTTEAPDYQVYDEPEVAATFSQSLEGGSRHAQLLLGGITCAACTWLIEQSLGQVDGVIKVNVNLGQSRLDLHYDPRRVELSALFSHIDRLGYRPQPFLAQARRDQLDREHRRDLRRLAVAGLGMMQVGMFAIALHAGDIQGIAAEYRGLMRWVSLIITSFVVLFSARTFFSTAWRHLRAGMLVMDLPVAIAIGLAWLASCWATVSGTGQVYFDSVVMFTFFLLLGRFLEQRVRRRYQLEWYDLENSLPQAVRAWRDGQWQSIPRNRLEAGDRVLVPAGSTLPIDGLICEGRSAVREDTFNGEQLPRNVSAGDTVFAGTLNLEGTLELRASGSFADTRLAALQQSLGKASGEKPRLAQLADRVAAWFVLGILLTTGGTALAWSLVAPEQAFWISLSVLVISCPCALALATPVALTSAASSLRHQAVLVHGENALDALARTTRVVIDKTGTLTAGTLELEQVLPLADAGEQRLRALAASLQQSSRHPVARVFDTTPGDGRFEALVYVVGAGVRGELDGIEYRMGSAGFCRAIAPQLPGPPDQRRYWVALVRENGPLGWFAFDDRPREDAPALLAAFRAAGLPVEILSGDTAVRVASLAQTLGVANWRAGLSPQEKMAHVAALQRDGDIVLAVGDGLNDAPLLSMANASFAVSEATDLARAQADFVIERGDLASVIRTWRTALRARRITLQNFAWALAYNGGAIPLAALGFVPPWAAAIGMSGSSLLVVLNSLRLTRDRKPA